MLNNIKMPEFNLKNEIEFANELYKKAIVGLEDEEKPPKPLEWLEDGEHFEKAWKDLKSSIEEFKKDEEEQVKAFLQCSLSFYAEFMCTLYKKMGEVSEGNKKKLRNSL